MNTKHTPGPWITLNNWHVNSQNEPLTICDLFKTRSIGETNANAKLIAAAPELLEALQGILETGYYSSEWGNKALTAIKKATE